MQAVKKRVEGAKIEKDEKQRKRQEHIRMEQESERKLRAAFRVGGFLILLTTIQHQSFLQGALSYSIAKT
jgi:hypothetical protein